ncbi:HlyD family efflux transporter periplasmic adaptor subunit [Persephonella atlantica]|uniref:HlyD family efflux transporter periplasmic adaptor subunit n=1 Tax=Persephonella atlantica TaxID=2699429 RepID=A0ABS1GFK9_9AQUI|nr:HlyD family secretion protein [Persephonella atlantica]MBK3331718.1 HlyD family efflux transporter periplasmic adaptor subunit [Persephonella atlantica]
MNFIKKYWLGIVVGALFLFAVYLIYLKLSPKELPPNLVAGVGRIDGDLILLSSKYPGKIIKILVSEGDSVYKGQVVAQLESDEYTAQLKSIEAQIKAKKRQLRAKEIQLKITEETLPEDVKKAVQFINAQEAMLKELEKSIDTLEKVVSQDRKDYRRIQNLYKKNLVSEKKLEEIKLKLETDINRLKSLYDKKSQITAKIKASQSSLKQSKSVLKKIQALKEEIEAVKSVINSLKANKEQIEAVISSLSIKSPVSGYVVDKLRNEGEVVSAGMPIITVIDPSQLYLKIYVDTIHNGKIKIGDRAVIFLDAYPDRPISAEVVKIAKRAEFTPKEVAVREDRIQRVYAVHIKPLKPQPLFKLGLPAIGIISLDGKGLPKSLKDIPEI